MAKQRKGFSGPDPTQTQRAGDVEPLPGGRISFLAPLPLPTGEPAINEGAVSQLNDAWLDYGAGWPGVFGNQLILGGTFVSFLLMAYLLPLSVSPFISAALFKAVLGEAIKLAAITAFFAIIALVWGGLFLSTRSVKR